MRISHIRSFPTLIIILNSGTMRSNDLKICCGLGDVLEWTKVPVSMENLSMARNSLAQLALQLLERGNFGAQSSNRMLKSRIRCFVLKDSEGLRKPCDHFDTRNERIAAMLNMFSSRFMMSVAGYCHTAMDHDKNPNTHA